MKLVKLFKSLENETEQLEREINNWLIEEQANLISITGNIAPQSQFAHPTNRSAPSDILMIVTYEPATVTA